MKCEMCGVGIGLGGARGRAPRYCSSACRQRAYRARVKDAPVGVPAAMISADRWVRRFGKRPLTAKGWPASSTNPGTWGSHAEVMASSKGDGYGFMLGGGIGCIDLDGCISADGVLADWARLILDKCPPTYVEVSMSGTGLHIFGLLAEAPGRGQRAGDGVEFYSTARFMAVSGAPFEGARGRLGDLAEVVLTL